MTRKEMQTRLEEHCDAHWEKYSLCHGCPLWTAISPKEGCYDDSISNEQLLRNYRIVFEGGSV